MSIRPTYSPGLGDDDKAEVCDNYYSPLKVFHHRSRIDQFRSGVRPDLLHVQLILTNRCNQHCRFCAYRLRGYSSGEDFWARHTITLDKVIETVDACRRLGVKAIEITGGGEPTVHPYFVEVCAHIRKRGFDYGVVTNGSHMPYRIIEALSHAKWTRVSIDAGCAKTYAALRRSSPQAFYSTRNNVRTLVAARRGADPVIGIGFVVTRDNWPEIVHAAANAKKDGADNFRISAVFQNDGIGYFRDFHDAATELCRQAQTLSGDGFTVFNLFGDRLDDLSQGSPDNAFCGYQHLCTYIGADQIIYRCCVLAYSQRGRLGSIADMLFDEAWRSADVGEKLQAFDARECSRCMFNDKNRTIRYAIEPNPKHVSFI